ncbi:MAG TPA: hypothetical protein VN026_15670 [Bacteroidia bacterium]|jgi:hypothetical protein|nr:hypothetical protein [Bacteroidia bacterium]
MKNVLILCLVFFGVNSFSQDLSKMLQANKWYLKYDTNTMKLIYSKKNVSKDHESMEFRENGNIVWCGTVEESSFNAEGMETQSSNFTCDSTRKYQVKNGKLMTQSLKQAPEYFKLTKKGETFELTPIKEEDFK